MVATLVVEVREVALEFERIVDRLGRAPAGIRQAEEDSRRASVDGYVVDTMFFDQRKAAVGSIH